MKPTNLTWPQYVERGLDGRLRRLGERWQVHWLIYNPLLFLYYHRSAIANAPGVIRAMRDVFPQTMQWADVGAGSGAYAARAVRSGVAVVSYEHSLFGRFFANLQGVRARAFDLRTARPPTLRDSVDLAYSFEVAEHLPPDLGDSLVAFLAKLAPIVVFTAAPPGQGGTGHLNEQPRSYWIERFARHDMQLSIKLSERLRSRFAAVIVDAPWLVRNLMVFVTREGEEDFA